MKHKEINKREIIITGKYRNVILKKNILKLIILQKEVRKYRNEFIQVHIAQKIY